MMPIIRLRTPETQNTGAAEDVEAQRPTEGRQHTSLGQRILQRTGINRVFTGITNAVGRLYQTLRGYTAGRGHEHPEPRAGLSAIQRENQQLLQNIYNNLKTGQFQLPMQDGINKALEKVKQETAGITKIDPKNVLGNALLQLKAKPQFLGEPLTDKNISHALGSEIKKQLLKEEVAHTLAKNLTSRGLGADASTMATLIHSEEHQINSLYRLPKNELRSHIDNIAGGLTDKAQNMKNFTQAKKDAQDLYVRETMKLYKGFTPEMIKEHENYKFLGQRMDLEAITHEDQELTRNQGKLPVISKEKYNQLFQKITTNFLKEQYGIENTQI